jgi:restriction endonuclease S subunit
MGVGATFKEVSKAIVSKIQIPIPPLVEQQRIAALLDTADRILKQRESSIAKLENLIRSYFEFELAVLKNSSKDELVELGSVVELKYGKSLPSQNRRVGKYNVYGSNGVVGSHIESITSGETIIVGRKGSFGEINLSLESCFPIDTTYYIDKSATKQNIVWLRYALETLKLNTLNKSAAVPGLNREDAYRQKLQLIGRSLQNDFEIYARKVWEIIKIQNDFICKHKKLIASLQHQSFAVN